MEVSKSEDVKTDDKVYYNFGLVNLGNTCFANAALQLIFSMSELRDYFMSDEMWEKDLITLCKNKQCKTEDDILNIVKKYFCVIFYKLLSVSGDVKNPIPIFGLLRYRNPNNGIQFGAQNDSHEFLSLILNDLNDEIFRIKNGLDVDDKKICNNCKSIITDLLNVKFKVNLDYLTYDKKEELEQDNLYFILNLKPENKTIQDSINEYLKEETIKGFYETPDKETEIKKLISIKSTSKYLLFHIARFSQNNGSTSKNNQPLEITEIINIPVEDQNKTYELMSVVVHNGSLSGGHYYNYSKREGEWYCFNDSSVSKTELDNVLSSVSSGSAYIVLYKEK